MENDFTLEESVLKELSKKIPTELAEDLTSTYEEVLVEYRKGHWEETLWRGGKFAENTFRVLMFLVSGEMEKEAPNFNESKEKLERAPSKQLPESVRILIPRIATSLIYDPRSKRAAVHVKEISPDYLDANLVISACSWILAEFLRLYHTSDPSKIAELMNILVQRKVPFIEKHNDKVFVTKPIDCRSEILLLLLNSPNGISRKEVGNVLSRYYTQGRITQSLQELERERQILKTNGEYVISGVGEAQINKVLSTLV